MAELQLKFLGEIDVAIDGVSIHELKSKKAIALLCYLAVTQKSQSRLVLATLLWGDKPDANARMNLRKAVAALRKVVGPYLEIGRESIALNADSSHWLDVSALETAVKRAAATELVGEADIDQLVTAVELYQGDFLQGFYVRNAPLFEEWMVTQQARLREAVAQALHQLAVYWSKHGRLRKAIAHTKRLLELDPWREEAHRQLMFLLATHGKRGEALAQFESCRRILAEEFGVDPSPATAELQERIRDGSLRQVLPVRAVSDAHREQLTAGAPPEAITFEGPANNLPADSTPFIGREREIAEIIGRLEDPACRLVSLVGPGGIGKTRLALQVGADQATAYANGVWWAQLLGVSSADYMLSAVAEAMEFSANQQRGLRAQLLAYLREKEMLIILDNLEHLLESMDPISDILNTAPGVKILATSRERLGLQAESLFDLRGLRYPEHGETPELGGYEAVKLFLDRATRLSSSAEIGDQDLPYVGQICQQLEGVPLGIELAAAWTRTLSCPEIVEEINRGYDFLLSSYRDLPERHRSLRAVFNYSWELLTPADKSAFRRLSIFRGGFARQAALEVAATSLRQLLSLVDKSLIRRNLAGRYEMHELVRQYAAEKLELASPDGVNTRDLHCRYYAKFLKASEDQLYDRNQKDILEAIGEEIENVREAWGWAIALGKKQEILYSLESLCRFYETRSWFAEGEDLFSEASAHLKELWLESEDTADPEKRHIVAMMLGRHALFAYRLGDYDTAERAVAEGLSITQELSEERETALLLGTLGNVKTRQGEFSAAKKVLEQSLEVLKQYPDKQALATGLNNLSVTTRFLGENAEAKVLLQESLNLYRELGHLRGIALCTHNLGWTAYIDGKYDLAQRLLQESEAVFREIEDLWGTANSLYNLGTVAMAQREYEEASDLLERSLSIRKEIGDREGIAYALSELGYLMALKGNGQEGERLCRKSLTLFREIGVQWGISVSITHLGYIARMQGMYSRAKELHEQSLAVRKKMDNVWGIAHSTKDLGHIAVLRGELDVARQCFHESLTVAVGAGLHTSVMLDCLVGLAMVSSASQDKALALETLVSALQHPALDGEMVDKAEYLLAELQDDMDSTAFEAAWDRGTQAKVSNMVEDFLTSGRT